MSLIAVAVSSYSQDLDSLRRQVEGLERRMKLDNANVRQAGLRLKGSGFSFIAGIGCSAIGATFLALQNKGGDKTAFQAVGYSFIGIGATLNIVGVAGFIRAGNRLSWVHVDEKVQPL